MAIQGLERRLKGRVTQTELAARWDVSQGSVSVWLAGKGMPEDREIVKRIAKDCDVDPGWLDWGTRPAAGEPTDGGDSGEGRRLG